MVTAQRILQNIKCRDHLLNKDRRQLLKTEAKILLKQSLLSVITLT